MGVSAGSVMSRLPVSQAPPVPAAAPINPHSRLARSGGTGARVGCGRICIRRRGLLLVRGFLASRQRKQQAQSRQRCKGKTTIHELPPVGVGSINDTTNASDVNFDIADGGRNEQPLL